MHDGDALAQFAAKTLDEIDGDEDTPEDARIVDAVLIVEATATDESGDRISMVQGFTMSERNVVGIGLMVRALAAFLETDDG